jgi:hypothetical protein
MCTNTDAEDLQVRPQRLHLRTLRRWRSCELRRADASLQEWTGRFACLGYIGLIDPEPNQQVANVA